MSDLSASEAFAIYSNNRATIVQLWSFYSGVTLAILAFTVGSDKKIRRRPFEIGLIVAGYVAFAFGNAWAVVSSQAELEWMANGLRVLMANDPSRPFFSVNPIPLEAVMLFYIVVTAVVSITIVIRLNRQQEPDELPKVSLTL